MVGERVSKRKPIFRIGIRSREHNYDPTRCTPPTSGVGAPAAGSPHKFFLIISKIRHEPVRTCWFHLMHILTTTGSHMAFRPRIPEITVNLYGNLPD